MAFDRSLWEEVFSKEQFPSFPCPRCKRGRVSVGSSKLFIVEPTYSKAAHKHIDWEPDWLVERFSGHLSCTEKECGETVVVSGDTSTIEVWDDEVGFFVHSVLRPKSMFPSPPIIAIPKETPNEIEEKIKAAFGLFWLDIGSSANNLRTSVESLLDHLKVPKTAIVKKTGESVSLDLNGRIQYYEKTNPDHASTFHALRVVGNLGSHGSKLKREAVLDAFEIYEDALAEVIGGRKAYLDSLKKKIIENKGKA